MFTGPVAHKGTSATTISAGGTTEKGTTEPEVQEVYGVQ